VDGTPQFGVEPLSGCASNWRGDQFLPVAGCHSVPL